jgi:hypothetical protein
VTKYEFKTTFSSRIDGRGEVYMKTQGVGRKMHPKEVLPAIAPFISRERREKVELEKKGGPVEGGSKTRPAL